MEEAEHIEEVPLAERALDLIPGGASTGSKQYHVLYGDDAPSALPSHFISALGCEVTFADGTTAIDFGMALGAVSIGYAEETVTHAVMRAIGAGNVSSFSPYLELEIAERLASVIPLAERVRFLKTGAEGVAAAVRLARAATGRSKVIGSGYFGWLDWCSTQPGVPDGVQKDYTAVPFNDIAAMERAAAECGADLAAIIIEPVVEILADESWVRGAREICSRTGAVLIFDEVKTGFRLRLGGYQELTGIEPDLAVFGKAMANGFPLSAVVGRAPLMNLAEKSWISSTLASETAALAAAGAVLDWHERAEVCETLWSTGADMKKIVSQAIAASGMEGAEVRGEDPMWFVHFDDARRQRRFTALALESGVYLKRGAYNFPSLSHDDDALRVLEHAASSALVSLLEEEAGESWNSHDGDV